MFLLPIIWHGQQALQWDEMAATARRCDAAEAELAALRDDLQRAAAEQHCRQQWREAALTAACAVAPGAPPRAAPITAPKRTSPPLRRGSGASSSTEQQGSRTSSRAAVWNPKSIYYLTYATST